MNPDFEKIKMNLLQLPNVRAVGRGAERIEVSVVKKVAEAALSANEVVPKSFAGKRTNVTQTGVIRALDVNTGRYRPAPGGVSVGHVAITAGTLGLWVQKNDRWYILSNNHVLADSNEAQIGDPILQPGAHDDGTFPLDHIANLSEFVKIHFEGEESDCG